MKFSVEVLIVGGGPIPSGAFSGAFNEIGIPESLIKKRALKRHLLF